MTPSRSRLERRLAPRQTAYVVLGGVVAALAAPFVWALAGLATGLAVLVVGVVIIGLLLVVSEGLSRWHRARAAALLGVSVAAPARPAAPGWRGWTARLGRASTWRQLAYHALVAPVLLAASAALLAFCWGGGLVLVTAPLWSRISPDTAALSGGVLEGVGRIWAQTAIGFGCLVIAPRLARGLAALDLAILRPMLGETRGEQLSPRVTALEQTRAGVIDAADAERRRIERDLHDGAQQRLTSLALNLGMARSALATDAPPATRRAIEDAHDEAKQALAELRGFVRGLHPAVLDERGLDAALSGIVARSPVPTSLHVLLAQRPPRTLEAVAYFVVSEALTNIARHSGATSATVRATSDARRLVVEVSDNGRGGAAIGAGSGLTGLTNRVASVDGTLTVTSPVGGPTLLEGGDAMRVVIAEDSILLRDGLIRLLAANGIEVVEAVGDAEAALVAVERHRPDLALLDVRMPPTHTDEGLRAALVIRAQWPGVALLILSQYVEERYAADLLASTTSAVGYLLKDRVADVDDFVDSLRRVADGGTALDPEVVAQLLLRRDKSPLHRLTDRERETLALMAEGRSNTGIARALHVSESAVAKHVTAIFTKLDMPTAAGDHRRVLAVLQYLSD